MMDLNAGLEKQLRRGGGVYDLLWYASIVVVIAWALHYFFP